MLLLRLTICLFTFCATIYLVNSAGLNEEFTWTRIDYLWPRESRSGFGGYRPNRPNKVIPSSSGGFIFPNDYDDKPPSYNEKTTTSVPSISTAAPTTSTTRQSTSVADVSYIYENNIPMGANRWKDKLFVTIPRRRNGVPSSLNYVPINSKERHNVPLIPYPDWETNILYGEDGQDHLVSVYRVATDDCDRLWLVDTGVIEILGNNTQVQPPGIVIFDLNTDKLIRRFTLPPEVLRGPSLANLAIDVTSKTCDDAYAYIPDLAGYGLIVYSYKANAAWRVTHNYFFLEPLAGEFSIGGHMFQWNDGVFSVELSKIQPDGFRNLYFHSMAGTHMYSVSTKILRDRELATRSYHRDDFKVLGDRGKGSQTSAADLHKDTGILFLGLVNQNAVGCWNTNHKFTKKNFAVILKDDDKMIYPCDVKIHENDVIVLSNKMPRFLYGRLNYDETNFRIWMNNVEKAVEGTICGSSGNDTTAGGKRPARNGRY